MFKFDVEISIIETSHSLFESHLAAQVCTVYYEIYLAEHFVQKSRDPTYCTLLNSKLCHGYFSANITKC